MSATLRGIARTEHTGKVSSNVANLRCMCITTRAHSRKVVYATLMCICITTHAHNTQVKLQQNIVLGQRMYPQLASMGLMRQIFFYICLFTGRSVERRNSKRPLYSDFI